MQTKSNVNIIVINVAAVFVLVSPRRQHLPSLGVFRIELVVAAAAADNDDDDKLGAHHMTSFSCMILYAAAPQALRFM